MASGASQRRSFRRVGSAPKDSGLALNAPSEPSVKAWRPVVPEVLRKLASGMRLADRSVNAQQYWRWSCTQAATGTGQPTSQQLVDFLCCVVPYEELATLVHRLQRRTAGLGGLWYEFCDQHGMRASDPYTAEAVPLLEFVCVAIERAPDRVVLLKRPSKYTPFVALAVQCAMERLEQNSCRSPTGNVPRPRSARLLCGERGKVASGRASPLSTRKRMWSHVAPPVLSCPSPPRKMGASVKQTSAQAAGPVRTWRSSSNRSWASRRTIPRRGLDASHPLDALAGSGARNMQPAVPVRQQRSCCCVDALGHRW
mmetsp:Transcript_94754/g.267505  ORF Transcript_94754/g.267505 Transcript_94754/m.267505 type:complete len:312 (+) Transcript_94754:61-996(+)